MNPDDWSTLELCCHDFNAMKRNSVVRREAVTCDLEDRCVFKAINPSVGGQTFNPFHCPVHDRHYCAFCVDLAEKQFTSKSAMTSPCRVESEQG